MDDLNKVKRKREIAALYIILGVIVLVTVIEVLFSRYGRLLPVPNNIIIFGLLNLNAILLLLLAFFLVRSLVKLFAEKKKGIFGTKIRIKLVTAFIVTSIVPTVLLFVVSIAFITVNIENWLNVQFENSLKNALEISQEYYSDIKNKVLQSTEKMVPDMSEITSQKDLERYFSENKNRLNFSIIHVYSAKGKLLYHVSGNDIPGAKKINLYKNKEKSFTDILSLKDGEIIFSQVPVKNRYLVAGIYNKVAVSGKAKLVSEAYTEYKQIKMLKNPIKASYYIVFTAFFLLVVFTAIWASFYFAKGITVPVLKLAEGTKEVAAGNLDFKLENPSDDEIGYLFESFNKMTGDLHESSNKLLEIQKELEKRSQYVETIINNVAAGVISIDENGKIATVNSSAEKMLKIKADKVMGKPFKEILRDEHLKIAQEIIEEFRIKKADIAQKEIYPVVGDEKLNLMVTATILRDEDKKNLGIVLVLEDLTHILKAQRAAAWREVAKRIAHEIKNPLTPIKLSAQRLRRKYMDFLDADKKEVFDECTGTIVNQVEALTHLVDEFSKFARMPAAKPEINDLNSLADEVYLLYKTAHSKLNISFIRDEALPSLLLDKEQIKRAMINILDNAVTAVGDEGNIIISTGFDKELNLALIEISDDGCGIQNEDKQKLFEPHFSKKKGGTGLGLAIVSDIVADHNGFVRIKDNIPKGTVVTIELPVRENG